MANFLTNTSWPAALVMIALIIAVVILVCFIHGNRIKDAVRREVKLERLRIEKQFASQLIEQEK